MTQKHEMNDLINKKRYVTPELVLIGSVTALTGHNMDGEWLDNCMTSAWKPNFDTVCT